MFVSPAQSAPWRRVMPGLLFSAVLGVAAIQLWLEQSLYSHPHVAGGLLLGGTIGLWLGHRDKSGPGPVLKDLQLMMIGPAWLLSVLYRRLGIPF